MESEDEDYTAEQNRGGKYWVLKNLLNFLVIPTMKLILLWNFYFHETVDSFYY